MKQQQKVSGEEAGSSSTGEILPTETNEKDVEEPTSSNDNLMARNNTQQKKNI